MDYVSEFVCGRTHILQYNATSRIDFFKSTLEKIANLRQKKFSRQHKHFLAYLFWSTAKYTKTIFLNNSKHSTFLKPYIYIYRTFSNTMRKRIQLKFIKR